MSENRTSDLLTEGDLGATALLVAVSRCSCNGSGCVNGDAVAASWLWSCELRSAAEIQCQFKFFFINNSSQIN